MLTREGLQAILDRIKFRNWRFLAMSDRSFRVVRPDRTDRAYEAAGVLDAGYNFVDLARRLRIAIRQAFERELREELVYESQIVKRTSLDEMIESLIDC